MATIKLIDEQCDEVSVISHNKPYKNGQRAKDKKTFSQFKYNNVVFTVDSENPFISAFAEGKIDSIKLTEGTRESVTVDANGEEQTAIVPTLTFDSYISFAQTLNRAEHKSKIARFKHLEATPVSADLLSELTA